MSRAIVRILAGVFPPPVAREAMWKMLRGQALVLTPIVLLISLPVLALPLSSGRGTIPQPHRRGRALLVGINYEGHPIAKPLPGSEEDAVETAEFIKQRYGFLDSEIHLLLGRRATGANIVGEFREWLIKGTQPGDRVFFLYSGHGSQLPDDNGDEADGLDETLAPCDVSQDPRSHIRDDLINELIKQLSGRAVVMVFDSCHSGTISRGLRGGPATDPLIAPKYFPSPEQLAEMRERSRSIGGGADDYAVLPSAQSRDLNLVVSRKSAPPSDVVVFSASQADQMAYNIKIGGQYRGALSYVFNEAQRNGPLPLGELERRISSEIDRLHFQKLLLGDQRPAFEVFSSAPLVDTPLFGAAASAVSSPPGNPQSRVKLGISTIDGRVRYFFGTEDGRPYGDTIAYRISTDAAGYLYLLVFSERNVATCIFPNGEEKDNRIEPGTHRFPRLAAGFHAQEPEGKDVVVALLSTNRLNLGEKENYTWDEILERAGDTRLIEYVRTRGIGVRPKNVTPSLGLTDWQSVSIVLEAKRQDR